MSKHMPFVADDYVPVELRHRLDGWTPARQVDFLLALSESACVDDACRTVGMSPASAYALRRRIEAVSFRKAWEAALDYGVARLADAALSRALNGVARPVFYKGEQVGERRYFDERLTMFILRLRDSRNYGQWRDPTAIFPQGKDVMAERAEQLIEATERDAGAVSGDDVS
ncbi:MAG: hypothetical protein LH485_08805 [Sphingomonas bacterium]|nr:hypothetical protein [Sphingomonas bacterium]